MEQLSKTDKRAARVAIDVALQRDLNKILNECYNLLSEWKTEAPADNRNTYQRLYQAIRENDKYIAAQYDGLTGSRYFFTVVSLLLGGVLSEDDLKDFSDEMRADLLKTASPIKNI